MSFMDPHPHPLIKSLPHFHYVYHQFTHMHQIEGKEDQTSKMSLSFMSSDPNNFRVHSQWRLTVIKGIVKRENELFEALVSLVT